MSQNSVAYTPKAHDNIQALSEADRAALYHTVNLLRHDAFPYELTKSGKLVRVYNTAYLTLTPAVAFGYIWDPTDRHILIVAGDPTKDGG